MNIAINDNITSNLLNLIYATSFNSSESMNVLNISCDVSRIYKGLISKYSNCNVLNIEMDNFYNDNIEDVPNTILGDIHGLKLDYDKKSFDLVIFDDSIQRFENPWSLFDSLKEYISDDGYLLASIPNVMHINMLSALISGKFSYEDYGPLNKANLRFFTLTEIRKLFDFTGYSLVDISAVSSEKTAQSMAFVDKVYPNAPQDIVDQFHSYEYVLKSRPKPVKTLYDYVYNS